MEKINVFNSSEDIKQNDLNNYHDFDPDSNNALGSMLEENFDPDGDHTISVVQPYKGPNDSTKTLHENYILFFKLSQLKFD